MQVVDEELPKHLHSWLKSLLDILSTITLISFIMPVFSLAVCPLIIIFFCIQVRQFPMNIWPEVFYISKLPCNIKHGLQVVIILSLSVSFFFSSHANKTHGGKPCFSYFSGVCDTLCWSSTFWAKTQGGVSDALPPSLTSKPAGQVQQNHLRKVKKHIHFAYTGGLWRIPGGLQVAK